MLRKTGVKAPTSSNNLSFTPTPTSFKICTDFTLQTKCLTFHVRSIENFIFKNFEWRKLQNAIHCNLELRGSLVRISPILWWHRYVTEPRDLWFIIYRSTTTNISLRELVPVQSNPYLENAYHFPLLCHLNRLGYPAFSSKTHLLISSPASLIVRVWWKNGYSSRRSHWICC